MLRGTKHKSDKIYSKTTTEDFVRARTAARLVCGIDDAERVYRLAKRLGSKYDDNILHAAAYLHDIELGKDHEIRSAKTAEKFLKKYMDELDIFETKRAILEHTMLGEPKSVEAILIHDADLLTYLGVSGFIRMAFAAREWHGKQILKDILFFIRNIREKLPDKLILKQSKDLAAENLRMMDLMLEEVSKEIK